MRPTGVENRRRNSSAGPLTVDPAAGVEFTSGDCLEVVKENGAVAETHAEIGRHTAANRFKGMERFNAILPSPDG
jgi:hypothetical protein